MRTKGGKMTGTAGHRLSSWRLDAVSQSLVSQKEQTVVHQKSGRSLSRIRESCSRRLTVHLKCSQAIIMIMIDSQVYSLCTVAKVIVKGTKMRRPFSSCWSEGEAIFPWLRFQGTKVARDFFVSWIQSSFYPTSHQKGKLYFLSHFTFLLLTVLTPKWGTISSSLDSQVYTTWLTSPFIIFGLLLLLLLLRFARSSGTFQLVSHSHAIHFGSHTDATSSYFSPFLFWKLIYQPPASLLAHRHSLLLLQQQQRSL